MAIISSPFPPVSVPEQALHDYVFERARAAGDKTALIDGASGRALSYRELLTQSARVAAALQRRGLGRGDVVALYCPNLPEYAAAFLGVAAAGGVVTTVNPLYTAAELRHQIDDAGARLLVTVADAEARARDAAAGSGVGEILVLGGDGSFDRILADDSLPPPRAVGLDPRRDLVVLPYSSGTTGLPKGVMLSHYNLVANLAQIDAAKLGVAGVEADTVQIGVLPFFHIYGMVAVMLQTLVKGATLVTLSRFDLETFLALIDRYRVSVARIVPPIVLALAKHPLVDKYRLDSLKSVFSGAAPLGDELADALRRRLPHCRISQGYGMTELSPVSHMNPDPAGVIDLASIGPPLSSTECCIVDVVSGERLGPDRDGELWVRGPQVMQGYLNNPDATAATLDADGWLHTGDIARYDGRGYFTIVDRVKELIKYKGLQIAPAELEALLLTHPNVTDAAVVGVPDDEAGEIPKAFVVYRREPDPDAVLTFVAERVAPYKKLRAIETVDAIPKSASGKILRRTLRARAASG